MARLGMGVKKHAQDELRVRWELKSWIIEAALARMGTRSLTEEQQREVWNAAHKPETVAWPAWWSYRG